jgi:predicted dehydrogenase
MISPEEIKVAVIGAGYMAQEHIKVFSSINGVKVVGIHSRTKSKAQAVATQFDIPFVATKITDLYENTKADLLVIAVSEMSVHSVAKQVFQYPWLSLIEKPAGYNYENALLIKDLAIKYQSRVYVSFNRRFYNSTRLILDELKQVEGQRLIQVYDQEEPLLLDRPAEVHQNWMYANSIHVIDYLKILGRGEITRVDPVIHWQPDTPGFVVAKIEYSSGDIGIYTAVWNAPGPWAATVTTQEKRWELKPLEHASVQPRGSRKLDPLPDHPWDTDFKPGLRMQSEEVLKALQGTPHSLVSLDESLESMQLVKDIYEV